MAMTIPFNPFGPPPAPPAPAPANPFAPRPIGVPAAMAAPYGQQSAIPGIPGDPYQHLAGIMAGGTPPAAPADPNVVDAEFTVVPPSPVVAPPVQTVLAPAVPPPTPSSVYKDALMTEAQITAEYITLRDDAKAMTERHAEELAPLKDRMTQLEQVMLDRLTKNGVESLRTDNGTASRKLTTRYNVGDPEVFRSWVEQNDQQQMYSKAVRQEAIRDYLESTGILPPGLTVFSQYGVQFRK